MVHGGRTITRKTKLTVSQTHVETVVLKSKNGNKG
jgi:hypothetical protein